MKVETWAQLSTTRRIINTLFLLFIVLIYADGILLTIIPPPTGYSPAIREALRQNVHTIGLALFAYANDHDGHYPEGKTSTEVFQQLMDGKYITDPSVFFNSWMPGKVRPQSDLLRAENVSWDVTCCVDLSDSDSVPVVFLTGYKVTYLASARALPIRPAPPLPPPKNWSEWLWGVYFPKPFIAAYYKNNSACAIMADPDGSIPNFIPADFDPKGKTYRQLTP